ncbi:MAG: hypothetical protein AB2L24_31825 [Mangrovibacterium sp.]
MNIRNIILFLFIYISSCSRYPPKVKDTLNTYYSQVDTILNGDTPWNLKIEQLNQASSEYRNIKTTIVYNM